MNNQTKTAEEIAKESLVKAEMYCVKNKYNPNQLVFIKNGADGPLGQAINLKAVLCEYANQFIPPSLPLEKIREEFDKFISKQSVNPNIETIFNFFKDYIQPKQEVAMPSDAIVFAEWCQLNSWFKYEGIDKWVCKDGKYYKGLRPMTGSELYKLFGGRCQPPVKEEGGWISIKDRMPTKENANNRGEILACNHIFTQIVQWDFQYLKEGFLINWMPLPSPPQTEINNKD